MLTGSVGVVSVNVWGFYMCMNMLQANTLTQLEI